MLNSKLKLNPNLFEDNLEERPIRDGFGEGLKKAGEENENIVALTADLTESTRMEEFAKKFPERFFQVGVAEQNLAVVAAGFGVSGKIPFISSYAIFSPGRNWEQIRTTIAYNDSNVKIAGHHAGISTGADGATHQATEDIALMRSMPNMKIIVPCDAIEAEKATLAVSKIWGPAYLRFSRNKTPIITTSETPFFPCRADIFWQPPSKKKKPEAVVIVCGFLVHSALVVARELSEKEGIETIVINNHTVKPMDEKTIIEAVKKCGAVVTVEDHQVFGGMGSAVAEILAREFPAPIEFVGIKDVFGESGSPSELLNKYGLGVQNIREAVKKVIKRKK